MNTLLAISLAQVFATLTYATLAFVYLIPKLGKMPLATVTTLLLIPHMFRFIALQIYSAIQNGSLGGTVDLYRYLILGDVGTAIVSIVAIWSIYFRWNWARLAVWAAVIFGTLDLVMAASTVLLLNVGGGLSDLTWLSFAMFVPLLWVSSALLIWQLWSRRNDDLLAAD